MFTSSASGIFLVWTARMPSRPFTSGRLTTMRRSKRPGRSSAGIEHVRAVGRRHEDDAFVRLEAVHFDEQLVERLLAFVVTAAQSCAAMPADRVNLVDEDDAGCVLLALFEEVADARRADADEHLDEVGAADREERNVGFAGHGPGQQRLACSRGAHEQDAFGNASAELLEFLRFLQELDDLLELFLRFVYARHVLERDLLLRAGRQLRAALAERQGLVPAALHLPHDEDPEANHQQDRRPRVEQRRPRAGRLRLGVDVDALLEQLVAKPFVLGRARRCGTCRCRCRRCRYSVPVISLPVMSTVATSPASTFWRNCENGIGVSDWRKVLRRNARSGPRRRRGPSRTASS